MTPILNDELIAKRISRVSGKVFDQMVFYSFNMWQKILIVLVGLNIVLAKQYLIQFEEEMLNKLQVSSSSSSIAYDQFEIPNKYQCAIECFKDKNTCTGYSFDETNKTCSLFEDSTKNLDDNMIELVKYRNERLIERVFFLNLEKTTFTQ